MKRYKIQIVQEISNGCKRSFFNMPKEEIIFQAILPEEEIDIKGVMREIVAGRMGVKSLDAMRL